VGLCVERSAALVVGALGILKAGGVYVALDPNYPQERLSFMLRDSGAGILVGSSGTPTALRSGAVFVDVDLRPFGTADGWTWRRSGRWWE
jgi:non-ribosomal peptide synthetase component F